jgi:UDP-N-acetylglucosamine diphosphorylase/glucosamine-1-phosphate N-acetyltransferase
MPRHIILYEDEKVTNLHPLTWTRPAWDLRIGAGTLADRIRRAYPDAKISYWCRAFMQDLAQELCADTEVNQTVDEDVLLINGRLLAPTDLAAQIPLDGPEVVYKVSGAAAVARLTAKTASRFVKGPVAEPEVLSSLPSEETSLTLIEYPWDLVNRNPAAIEEDFKILDRGGELVGSIDDGAHLLARENIHLAKGARIMAGAVLNAEEGPIWIDRDATVMHNAVIEGPAYVGPNSAIKIGAKIYEGTSIGEVCKVGGEVEQSIIHSYSNKQHDGFLGHAYVGMWVNIGADTNSSDLKNNYSNVDVFINGKKVDTGSMFVGLFMGDHAKSGINTMFNTGTVVGVGSNVFGGGFPPKYIPCFSWGGADGLSEYRLDKFFEVARRVMGRRKKELTRPQETLLREVFERTRKERDQV